jgi:hypothetical protein
VKRVLALAAALAAVWALAGLGASFASAASGAAPADPNATSSLALCGKSGQPISSGSTTARPFVWRAVSAAAAPTPYNQSGRTATLFAFQPRPDVEASEWSGDLLTASARYTDAAHPMAAATRLDEPLSDFLNEYPTKVDGLVQLRLYLGAPGEPAATLKYAAAMIRVTGHSWQLVGSPSTASCHAGSAVSLETILPALSAKPVSSTHAAPASKASASPRPTSTTAPAGGAVAASAPLHTQLSADEGHGHQELAVCIAALIAAVSVAWWRRMRRRPEETS